MSRFKLFSLFAGMLAAIAGNPGLSDQEKVKQNKAVNRKSGGLMFAANPYGPKQLNQRQKRKKWRQNPHTRRKAA